MDKQKILKQFCTQEEKFAFSKILDCITKCEHQNTVCFTDFLDPHKLMVFNSISANLPINVNYLIFGGIEYSERKMIGFYPTFTTLDNYSFPISSLNITYNKKYSKNLTHRDFLGSIIGMGLHRNVIGDIIINNDDVIIFINKTMTNYLCDNLKKVAFTNVTIKKINLNDVKCDEKIVNNYNITVSSLRLDVIINSVFKLSRSNISDLIKGEKVYINWILITNTSKAIKKNDIITVRGYGRIKINDIIGISKKGKTILYISKFS